jgi:hypothetical protein
MGGKGKSAPAPDYSPIAAANREAAEVSAQVAREQLAWAREQYDRDRGITDQVVGVMLGNMRSEAKAGAADRDRYQQMFQPVEDRLVQDAVADRDRYERVFRPVEDMLVQDSVADRNRYRQDTVPLEQALAREAREYDTEGRRELMAGRAVSDVSQAFDAARRGALANLESYGIDPSQTRAGALDLGVRTAQAAAAASAANDARLRTEDTARALRMDAINVGRSGIDATARASALGNQLTGSVGNAVNVGRGYPGQVASAFQTSQSAGQGAIGSQLGTTASGASTMGTGLGWQGQANTALGNWGNQVVSLNNAATQANTARAGQTASTIGSLAGAVGGVLAGPAGGAASSIAGKLLFG